MNNQLAQERSTKSGYERMLAKEWNRENLRQIEREKEKTVEL